MSSACIRRHHQLPPLRIGSDVDWVLAGSGSLSSGSARSRGQLIAAQRLDPQSTLFPKTDDTSTAPVRKGNPWTERKDIVAAGVGVRVHSASQRQLGPIDDEKSPVHIGLSRLPRGKIVKRFLIVDEQRPRVGVTSWTADLDASHSGIPLSQGTFHPLYLRLQSPPAISNLNNDSVEKGSFTLLPNKLSQSTLAGRGGEGVGHDKLNQTWPPPSSGCHSPRIPKTTSKKRGRRILEPLNSTNHDGSTHRGVSPARKVSPARRGTSPVPRPVSPMPRAVSPMSRAISPMPRAVSPMPRGISPMRVGAHSGGRHKIPPLSPRKKKDRVADSGFNIIADGRNDDIIDLTSVRKNRRRKRSTNKGKGIIAIEHDPPPPEEDQAELSPAIKGDAIDDCTIPQKPMLARQGVRHDMTPAAMFSENGGKIFNGLFTPPAEPFLPPVDPSTPQLSREQQTSPPPHQQDELEFKSLDENDEVPQDDQSAYMMVNSDMSAKDSLDAEERALKFQLLKEQEQLESFTVSPISVASAPAAIESPVTTTEVIELDTNSRGSVPSLNNLEPSPPLLLHEENTENVNDDHRVPRATYTTGSIIDLHLNVEDSIQNSVTMAPIKRTRRIKRPVGTKNTARTLKGTQLRDGTCSQQNNGPLPDTLRPVDKPKEGMQQCFTYLDNSEWEVTMQGLQLLMRLMHHHPETIHTHLHSVVVAVAKQVRNLRSQVARAACLASGELFLSQKRALETDLDELASSLLHRTADTNRFLRSDSNAALDKMIEVISPQKSVAVIVGKGISHQNAIVRTACARLLVNLVDKVGVDKVMTYPGDMRDKILITGSNLLTEGSLDTRCFAKQLFRMLSSYPTFNSVMTDVVPSHTLRNIRKTLQSLK